jgi:hypothetical protein
MIRLEDINKYGFIFHEYDHAEILKETDQESMDSLSVYISSLITLPNEILYADIDIINYGESIPLHYHIIPGSFQVVVWAPYGPYSGRYYLYGTKDDLRQIQPARGLMCFMKPNDPNFIHGVSPLYSTVPVKSYGFSSSLCPLLETNDIFIS